MDEKKPFLTILEQEELLIQLKKSQLYNEFNYNIENNEWLCIYCLNKNIKVKNDNEMNNSNENEFEFELEISEQHSDHQEAEKFYTNNSQQQQQQQVKAKAKAKEEEEEEEEDEEEVSIEVNLNNNVEPPKEIENKLPENDKIQPSQEDLHKRIKQELERADEYHAKYDSCMEDLKVYKAKYGDYENVNGQLIQQNEEFRKVITTQQEQNQLLQNIIIELGSSMNMQQKEMVNNMMQVQIFNINQSVAENAAQEEQVNSGCNCIIL